MNNERWLKVQLLAHSTCSQPGNVKATCGFVRDPTRYQLQTKLDICCSMKYQFSQMPPLLALLPFKIEFLSRQGIAEFVFVYHLTKFHQMTTE